MCETGVVGEVSQNEVAWLTSTVQIRRYSAVRKDASSLRLQSVKRFELLCTQLNFCWKSILLGS